MAGRTPQPARGVRAACLALLLWPAAGCGGAPQARVRNVLLVSIDTCRADRLGCYGYPSPTSPNIDALAAQGAQFLQTSATNALTLPSHTSMLTGTLPFVHGVFDNKFHLDDSTATLAELLARHGLATAAFVSAFVLDSSFGLDRGFAHYDDELGEHPEAEFADKWRINERNAQATTDAALTWLEAHHGEPFLAFVHYYDPHAIHEAPEPFASRFPGAPYDAEIAYVDSQIGRLLGELGRLGRADDTLVIVTSDHGESFGEHGEDSHSYFVYQSTIHVPLVIRAPAGVAGLRIEAPTSLVDLVPTVMGLLGLDLPAGVQGRDLTPLIDGGPAPEPARLAYAESLTPTLYRCAPLRAVRRGRWKYVWTVRPELYDLERDPGELENLVEQHPQEAGELRRELLGLLEGRRATGGSRAQDPASLERLQALGYVEGAVRVSYELDPDAADAKDRLQVYRGLRLAQGLVFEGQLEEAYAAFQAMLEQDPWLLEARAMLAGIRAEQGRFAEAAAQHEEYVRRVDAELVDAEADTADLLRAGLTTQLIELGQAYTELERLDEAERALRRAVDTAPADLPALNAYADFLGQRRRRFDEAIAVYRRAIRIEPDSAESQGNLGNCLFATGALAQAVLHYRLALAIEPESAQLQFNLGSALYAQGLQAEAVAPLSEAARLAPQWPDVQRTLGLALACAARPDEARAALRGALRADPRAGVRLRAEALSLAAHASQAARRPAAALLVADLLSEATGGRDADILDLLGVARAATGDFQGAIESAERALELAADAEPGLRARIEGHLSLYRGGTAFRLAD